jgi:hypothetical protein
VAEPFEGLRCMPSGYCIGFLPPSTWVSVTKHSDEIDLSAVDSDAEEAEADGEESAGVAAVDVDNAIVFGGAASASASAVDLSINPLIDLSCDMRQRGCCQQREQQERECK